MKLNDLFLALSFFSLLTQANNLDLSNLKKIPIQEEGRIKPLDSFARSYLLAFNAKENCQGLEPIEWMGELLFLQSKAYLRDCFYIPSPEILNMMGLEKRSSLRYNYHELRRAMKRVETQVAQIQKLDPATLSGSQKKIFELNKKYQSYSDLAGSLAFLAPNLEVKEEKAAKLLGLSLKTKYSLWELLRLGNLFAELSHTSKEVFSFSKQLQNIEYLGGDSVSFRVLPPLLGPSEEWVSPSSVIMKGSGNPQIATLFGHWREAIESYRNFDTQKFLADTQRLIEDTKSHLSAHQNSANSAEVIYNKFQFFNKALLLFLLTLLLYALKDSRFMKKFSHAPVFAYGAACVLLSIGILLRMYIMRRPPVTTLYESILFVSWVCASVSAILYNLQKKSIWLGVGSFLSFFLLYLSRGYAAEGDTLGVLIAVLNTNFWLATHVICMTIGYGLCLLLSVWAHLALVGRAYLSHDKSQWKANQNILWILTLLALLFSLVGTILGGLWADQSWGRFWGWDPKENGALFVVLWLLFLLHAKMNPKFFNLGFCVGSLLSSIVVALAWFGVNLLSVGLHSYGFTENIAWKLGSFCLLELVVAIFLLLKIQKMSRPYAQSL